MPFIHKQLALAIMLSLGVASTQDAQARGDMEPDSEWLDWIVMPDESRQFEPAVPGPDDFYFADRATSRNGLNVARVLDAAVDELYASDEISEQAKDELDDYGQYLSSLAPGQVGAALEQLAGSQNANLGTATQNALKQLNASLLSAVRQLDMDTRETGRVWLQGLDSGGRLDAQHGSAGLSQSTQGVLLGADWSIDHAWRIGVVGGKSGSDLSTKGFKGEVDSWHLGTYAARQDGPLSMRLGALYSSHRGQNKRSVDLGLLDYREQLSGKYKAHSQNAFAELGYQLDAAGWRAEPYAAVGFQRYQRDRFEEKGGYGALNVGAQTQQNLSNTFGVRVSQDFALGNRMTLKPHLSSSWKHLYGNVDSRVRQSFVHEKREDFNSEFTIGGTSLDRNSLALRTGLDLTLSAEHSVALAYTAEFGSNSRNQGLTGQWAMAF